MKDLVEIVNENRVGPIKKLDMLTIMVAYQMWKEYKLYDEFFGKLDKEELEDYEQQRSQMFAETGTLPPSKNTALYKIKLLVDRIPKEAKSRIFVGHNAKLD